MIEKFIDCIWPLPSRAPPAAVLPGTPPAAVLPEAPPTAVLPEAPPVAVLPRGLPQEAVDAIIGYLIRDKRSLQVCTLVCHSLRCAAAQHLHETLFIHSNPNSRYEWPKPLRRASNLSYLPYLTRVVIDGFDHGFSAGQFSRLDHQDFSRLENVRVLSISNLDLASFFPDLGTHFGQFFRNLRSLSLAGAKGSSRQFSFFIRSFPQLEDLELEYCVDNPQSTPENSPVPAFPTNPPLGGRCSISVCGEAIVAAVACLPSGLHFRHMQIMGRGTNHLLSACLETVETLELSGANVCGKQPLRKAL